MTFVFDSLPAMAFGNVPPLRTRYLVLTITGRISPPPVAARSVTLTAQSSFGPITPQPFFGWSGSGPLQQTITTATGEVSCRLVLAFHVPSGGVSAPPPTVLTVSSNVTGSNTLTLGADYTIPALANTSVTILLDQSHSMNTLISPGLTRFAVAQSAALAAIDLLDDLDSAELILFDQTAVRRVALGPLGPLAGGTARSQIKTEIGIATPKTTAGTCIASAVAMAKGSIKLIMSDCLEDAPPAVSTLLADKLRGVIGTPTLNQATATSLSPSANISIDSLSGDAPFYVKKLVTQALLAPLRTGIVLDPQATLLPGQSADFAFHTNELDLALKAVVLAPNPEEFRVTVTSNTPDGEPHPALSPVLRTGDDLLVATFPPNHDLLLPAHGVRMTVQRQQGLSGADASPTTFSLIVAADSDLVLDAELHTTSLVVGGDLLFSALVSEAGLPIEDRAHIKVELGYPDGGTAELHLHEGPGGRFGGRLPALRPGTYTAHFIATGRTLRHHQFRREMLQTVYISDPPACSDLC